MALHELLQQESQQFQAQHLHEEHASTEMYQQTVGWYGEAQPYKNLSLSSVRHLPPLPKLDQGVQTDQTSEVDQIAPEVHPIPQPTVAQDGC